MAWIDTCFDVRTRAMAWKDSCDDVKTRVRWRVDAIEFLILNQHVKVVIHNPLILT